MASNNIKKAANKMLDAKRKVKDKKTNDALWHTSTVEERAQYNYKPYKDYSERSRAQKVQEMESKKNRENLRLKKKNGK